MKSGRKRPAPAQARRQWDHPLFWAVLLGALIAAAVLARFWPSVPRTATGSQTNSVPSITAAPISNNLVSLPTGESPESHLSLDPPPTGEEYARLVEDGTVALQRGEHAMALNFYKAAEKLRSDDEEIHFNLGVAYARLGNPDAAIHHYQEALKLLPDYPEAHNNLGTAYLERRQVDEAIQEFTLALRIMPEYASALNNLGKALAMQGRTREAALQFGEAVRLNTNSLEAHVNLGNALLLLGNSEEAAEQFREAMRIEPNHPRAKSGLAAAQNNRKK